MRSFIFLIAVFILSAQISIAQTSQSVKPINYPTLWESDDPVLQQDLEKLVKQQGLWQQIKTRHLSLVVVDISDLKKPQVAALNGDKMFYAASLPKIVILLGAFVEIESGKLEESDEW